ncbi:hypothetical protein BD770DRAFT_299810, partial [Pilaira anomala]
CTPGESFDHEDGCNTCTCSASGFKVEAACTRLFCVDTSQCIPGTTFLAEDGCNTCLCPKNGLKTDAGC